MPKSVRSSESQKILSPENFAHGFAWFDKIALEWVRTHNLKNIDITLPKNKIITITWVSWSGKSSLAFSTIYKEGQFRYIESLSSYLRQFFDLGTRPELDFSSGLSPAIAIEQNKRVGNVRSTVWTLTEIDDYLRLLLAKVGDVFCHKCGTPLRPKTTEEIVQDIKAKFEWEKVYMIQEFGTFTDPNLLSRWVRKNRKQVDAGAGVTRYLVALEYNQETGDYWDLVEYFYLEEPNIPDSFLPAKIFGIFDRVTIDQSTLRRLKDDVIKMLSRAEKFGVFVLDEQTKEEVKKWKKKVKEVFKRLQAKDNIIWYTDKYYCPKDNISYPEFTTQHFSANRQEGACQWCQWLGEQLQVDFDKVIDPYSPYLKAILPWRDSNYGQGILQKLGQKYDVDMNVPWKDLPDRFKQVVMNGDDELLRVSTWWGKFVSLYYKGVQDVLTAQYNKWILTVDFQAMLDVQPCTVCHGARLRQESLHVFLIPGETSEVIKKWKDKVASTELLHEDQIPVKYNIFDLQSMPIEKLVSVMIDYQKKTNAPQELVERITIPLLDRAHTIDSLWMWYLNTARPIDSLSWWEIQRLRLAKQLGNKLTWIIYVLDEPTIWLDEWEIVKVIASIKALREMGNTIIVVEHNDTFIKASDWIVEIGPWAGDFGGEVLYNGDYENFLKQNTLTADYINGKRKVTAEFNHTQSNIELHIKKASKHNLKDVDVKIKLGSFTIITWPSGAGKTTLMYHTLFKFLSEKHQWIQSYIRLQLLKEWMSRSDIIQASIVQREKYEHLQKIAIQEFYKHIAVETITGYEDIENVMYVDQTSIGKTPRSCPATFIGVFDDIRKVYAGVTEAKMLAFNAGHFSFNSNKWACPECDGYGHKKIELQFLPDTYVPCSLCKWGRYKPEILDIKWHGKSISEVLGMYVKDAVVFFDDLDFISSKLDLMCDIGLWYLKMGQPAHTLSWWESQRLKLVKHLLKQYKGHTVYFLDEPTVGLHPNDIERLLNVLKKFLNNWDTVLMIEHERHLLKFADKVIRLEDGKVVKGVN